MYRKSSRFPTLCNSAWHQCHYTYDFNEDKPTVRKLGFSDDETKDILEKALKR